MNIRKLVVAVLLCAALGVVAPLRVAADVAFCTTISREVVLACWGDSKHVPEGILRLVKAVNLEPLTSYSRFTHSGSAEKQVHNRLARARRFARQLWRANH